MKLRFSVFHIDFKCRNVCIFLWNINTIFYEVEYYIFVKDYNDDLG